MLAGAGVAGAHMVLELTGAGFLWPGTSGLLGGALGLPLGLAAGIAISLVTPKPAADIDALVDDMRDPSGEALYDKAMRLAAVRNRPELPAVNTPAPGSNTDVPA